MAWCGPGIGYSKWGRGTLPLMYVRNGRNIFAPCDMLWLMVNDSARS